MNVRRLWALSGLVALTLGLGACAATAKPTSSTAGGSSCPWLNTQLSVSTRVQKLISAMTLTEKVAEMHVDSATKTGPYAGYEGYVPAQPSLCIPALPEQDDSTGVGAGATGVTQLPTATVLSSIWDPRLAYQYGVINGEEHYAKGIAMVLGPTINIQRDPRWGRNFETFSEDPYLTAQLGVQEILGIQSQHELVDVKHYAVYNQETNRNTPADNVIISNRALREIYLPAFHAAVTQGHAASVMCSYATMNGTDNCQNPYLLTDILGSWGFGGFVRSDGGATHSTVASLNAGLAQEKGSNYFLSIPGAVSSGQVSIATINEALSRIFTQMFDVGLFNNPPTGNLSSVVTTPQHAAFALQVAEEGTVLLQNQGPILPLPSSVQSIAVIGPDGTTSPLTTGGGSAHVDAPYVISPLQGITTRAGSAVHVSSYSGTDPAQAAAAAKSAQVAIVFASNYETEGKDLPNITLSGNQDQMIEAVAQANSNTIVVLNTGGPVLMPWLGQVKAVLEAWYPGQEDGNALAALLFGDVNPSGHLPETFPSSLSAMPTSTPQQFPGMNGQVQYSEGIFVGYRWYDANNVTPLFPFGFGLSYTNFTFSNLKVTPSTLALAAPSGGNAPITVTATVTNSGARAGATVVQLYVGDPPSTGEPPLQLKGFSRVSLNPGQSATVTFPVTAQDLAYWNTADNSWTVANGNYTFYVGDSSAQADLPLRGALTVAKTTGPQGVTVTAPASINPGSQITVTAHFTNSSDVTDTGLAITLAPSTGGAPAPESTAAQQLQVHPTGTTTFASVAPGSSVTASFRITVTSSAPAGTYQFNATVSYTTPAGKTSRGNFATTTLVYGKIQEAYNNVGITTPTAVQFGDLDGQGNSYSAALLGAKGISPGGKVSIGGTTITWPRANRTTSRPWARPSG